MEEIEQAFVTCKAFSLEKAILWTEDSYFGRKQWFEVKKHVYDGLVSFKLTAFHFTRH